MRKGWWLAAAHVNVPTASGGSVGTGCLVAPDRLLTAHHVVRHWASDRGPITISFRSEDGSDLATAAVAEILWSGEKAADQRHRDADLAVLRLSSEVSLDGLEIPDVAFVPAAAESWMSRCYPTDRPKGPSFGGEALPERGLLLELDARAEPIDSVLWEGCSGAPVIVGRSLVGVIFRRVPNVPSRLEAVPVSVFKDDAGFREACRLGEATASARAEWDRRHGRLRAAAARILQESPKLARALRAEIDGKELEATEFLDALFAKWNPKTAVLALLKTRRSIAADSDAKDVECLNAFTEYLLPFVAAKDERFAHELRGVKIGDVDVLQTSASDDMLAEIFRARREGRRMQTNRQEGDEQNGSARRNKKKAKRFVEVVPSRALFVALRPEVGVKEPFDLRGFVIAVAGKLGLPYAGDEKVNEWPDHKWTDCLKAVRTNLSAVLEDEELTTPYVLVRPPTEERFQIALRAAVKSIKDVLPRLPLEVLEPFDPDRDTMPVHLRRLYFGDEEKDRRS